MVHNGRRIITSICAGILASLLAVSVSCVDGSGNRTEPADRTVLPLEQVTPKGSERHFSAVHGGIKHDFIIYLPDERKREEVPLILMLPGYGESAERFRTHTLMDIDANKRGYAVVYVTGAPDPEDGTSNLGWNSGLRASVKDDVGFLVALAGYLQEEYRLSKNHTFVAGFSNGAFMAYRLAVEAPDAFRAVASVAGMMTEKTWNEKSDKADVGILQINGTNDDVIPMKRNGSDQASRAPAIEEVITYWAEANGLTLAEKEPVSDRAELTRFSDAAGKNEVWHVVIENGRHSWPQEPHAGFSANELILDFFDRYLE